jgi:nucleoside-diphosphate-sugar epimerase
MRVFVTGGTGFVGSPAEPGLIEDIEQGHYVT